MAALDRALALDERNHRAVMIGKQLHLDVTRSHDAALEVDGRVAEGRSGFRAGGAKRARQVVRAVHDAHALAAAAGHGLQHQRVAHLVGDAPHLRLGHVLTERLGGAGHHGHPGRDGRLARRRLAAHELDGLGRRPDEGEAGIATGTRKVFVLGEKAVAGMHGVGAALPRHLDQRVDAEIAVAGRVRADRIGLVGHAHVTGGAIALAVDRHGGDAHVATGADDAHGDFAAIGDENLGDGHETR